MTNSPMEFETQTRNQGSLTSLNHLRLANKRGRIPCVATENFMVEMQEWLISGSSLYCHLRAQTLAMTHMLTCQPSSALPPDGPSVIVTTGRCRNISAVGSLCPGRYISCNLCIPAEICATYLPGSALWRHRQTSVGEEDLSNEW